MIERKASPYATQVVVLSLLSFLSYLVYFSSSCRRWSMEHLLPATSPGPSSGHASIYIH
ncbi:hypothetical protein CSUI_004886 [Cystoisospora suis]|uniref:Uncharacterized protein n=1 Tax=Cystoisospora suis TaxID=483139 RepID=A0A2C6KZG7_9APIC|nr:hypothetical protein CSUI_004886 [Cystoisospora suis]